MAQRQSTTSEGTIIQINEDQIKDHLGEVVKGTVRDTLNALLDEEEAIVAMNAFVSLYGKRFPGACEW